MNASWANVCLKDITTIIGDGLHGTPEYDESGDYFFVNGNNLNNGSIQITSNTKKISEAEFVKYKKNLSDRTILVSINGTLGNTAFYNNEKVVLGKSACYLNVKESVNKYFVYYILRSSVFQNYIHNLATGSTIKNVSLKLMRDFTFRLPDREMQDRIVDVLLPVDQAIDLLKETNTTLEAIAQAIFKSWFVDFDPVHAKQQGVECAGIDKATADLFPSSFVQSELGLIPEGWRVGELAEIADFQNGYAFNSKQWSDVGCQVIKIGNVKAGVVEYDGCSFIKWQDTVGLERFKLNRGDLLVGMTGYVGETGLVYNNGIDAYLNQRVGRIANKVDINGRGFIYSCVRDGKYKKYAEALAGGSAQANISGKDLLGYQIIIPIKNCIDLFEQQVSPIISRILSNIEMSKTLASLRNTLLPRLMSGKLDLTEIEEQLQGVA